MTLLFDGVENSLHKRESTGWQHFLFLSHAFINTLFLGDIKTQEWVINGLYAETSLVHFTDSVKQHQAEQNSPYFLCC